MYTDKLKTIAAQIGDIQKDVVASNAATQRLLHTFKEKQRAPDDAQLDYNESNEKTKALLGSLDRTIHEQTFLHDILRKLKKSMIKNAEVFMKSTYEQTKVKMLGPVIMPTSQYGVLEFTYSGSDRVLIESVERCQKCELKSEVPKEPGKKENPKVVSLKVSSALLRQNSYIHLKTSSLTNSFVPFLLPVLVQECFEAVRVKKDGNHLLVSTDITNVWIRCADVELYCNGIKEDKVIHLTGGRPYALTVKDNIFPKDREIVLFKKMFARYAKPYSYLWRYVTDEQ